MEPRSSDDALVTVLYIGPAAPACVEGLQDHRVGVIGVDRVDRALRLLQNFQVAALIVDGPDTRAVPMLADAGTPVIELAATDATSDQPGVTVVARRTPSATLARIIRERVANRPDGQRRRAA